MRACQRVRSVALPSASEAQHPLLGQARVMLSDRAEYYVDVPIRLGPKGYFATRSGITVQLSQYGEGLLCSRSSPGQAARIRGCLPAARRGRSASILRPRGCPASERRGPGGRGADADDRGDEARLHPRSAVAGHGSDASGGAVPATRRGHDRDPRVHRLCRLLGFGFMAVSTTRDRVEMLVEPGPYQPRRDHLRRHCQS